MHARRALLLTAEAEALVERLQAAWHEARKAQDFSESARIVTIRVQAMRRLRRRLDAWAVAAYGPGVN